jgi:hypothetical protein
METLLRVSSNENGFQNELNELITETEEGMTKQIITAAQ